MMVLTLNARVVEKQQYKFSKIVEKLIQLELKKIKKPSKNIKLFKDEFETTAEFNQRVKKAKLKQRRVNNSYVKKYNKVKSRAKSKAIKKAIQFTWGKPILKNLKYDADNGYFLADVSFEMKRGFKKKVAVKVARKYARSFKNNFNSLKPQAIFDYDGKTVELKEIRVPYKKAKYIALFTDLKIDDTRVAVNISNDISIPTDIGSSITIVQNSGNRFDASKLKNFNELKNLLRKSKTVRKDSKKWLFTVGIEQYQYTNSISYAKRSAEMFKAVMKKRLGVPENNCYTMIDARASQARIKTNMKKMLRRVKKGDTIYFYYNGHGIPIPSMKNTPFMLASDSDPDYIADEKFFSLQNIYSKLSTSKAGKVIAIVDSCFSGVTDGKSILKGVAATKMVAKSVSFDKSKMVVLSAGKAHQYSNGYDEKAYRLFSFYIMKNIIKGDKTVKQLYKDTQKETASTSREKYGDLRVQDPTIEGNFRMKL